VYRCLSSKSFDIQVVIIVICRKQQLMKTMMMMAMWLRRNMLKM